jgi:hypothetical protein
MKTKIKTVLLLISLLSCIIYISSCKKSAAATAASIVGAWTQSSTTTRLYANNILTYDSTVPYTGTPNAITFNSNGFYTELTHSSYSGSAYTFAGNVLSIFDTIGQADIWQKLYVSTLTENTLSLQDTIFASSDTVGLYIINFTR